MLTVSPFETKEDLEKKEQMKNMIAEGDFGEIYKEEEEEKNNEEI